MILRFFQRFPFILFVVILIAVITSGVMDYGVRNHESKQDAWLQGQNYKTMAAIIASTPSERAKTYRYEAWCTPLTPNDSIAHTEVFHAYLYIAKDSLFPSMGDTLLVRTHLRAPDSIGTFDYASYLHRQGFDGIGYVRRNDWKIFGTNRVPWYKSARGWQHFLMDRYRQAGIEGAEYGTLCALTLGYREALEPDTKRAFSAAGAMHVLAVSGLHTGIVWMVLWMLLTGFGIYNPLYEQRWRQGILSAILVSLLWGYAAITGWSPSVVRSVVMLTILQGAIVAHRHSVSINTIAAAACIILLVRPNDLYSVSFQLSFAAVTAIILFVPFFNRLLPIPITLMKWVRVPLTYIRDMLTVSLAAQIGTIPLTLLYFGQVSTYFLLTNLIVLPLAWLIVSGAILFQLTSFIPIVGSGVGWLLKQLVHVLNLSVGNIESLPFSTIHFPITIAMSACLFVAIACAAIALRPKKRAWLWLIPALGSLFIFYELA